jgi:Short C-terminal domain
MHPPALAAAPAASAEDDPLTKLQQLADLRAQGILTEEELAAEKDRVLSW